MNKSIRIGSVNFELGRKTYIMGILNVTPDSFSDGGDYTSLEHAINHAKQMISEGVDIIDIGGESTRPGHIEVEEIEEIKRVIPIIKAIREFSNIPISIDTYKSNVAELAIKAGANLINDVWGFKKDTDMAKIAAKYQLPCCLMHNRTNRNYSNLIEDMIIDLNESIEIALTYGVKKENIILDPGIGFAKNYDENLEVMKNLNRFSELGFPILLGTSRKSFIGTILNGVSPKERVEGTITTTILGIINKCDFVRVHDVKENKRAAMVADAIIRV